MALRINTKAPDFTLKTADNKSFNLNAVLQNKSVVIFFYPKAFTRGCTKEACSFRNDYAFFNKMDIEVVGISHDSTDTLKKFQDSYILPYTLLSDPRRKVSALYEAVYPFGFLTKRITYFIDKSGIIKAVYDDLIDAENHLKQIKMRIERLPQSAFTN